VLGAWKVRLVLAAIFVGGIVVGVRAFVKQQRAIGAMQVQARQEQAVRDSLMRELVTQGMALDSARTAVTRADSAAVRATRLAQRLEHDFSAVVTQLDSAYATQADTARVPLSDLRAVRDAGIAAVGACVASRDSTQALADSLRGQCAEERRRADLHLARALSAERELTLIRSVSPPPTGRGVFWRGVGTGAATLYALVRLGVVRF
jgi:hypothetical protein